MSTVSIKSNANDLLRELKHDTDKFHGKGVQGSIYNTVPYAVYCEYGTRHMRPHKMIQGSAPSIEAKLKELLQSTRVMSPDSIALAVNKALAYGMLGPGMIRDRTHVDTGRLKGVNEFTEDPKSGWHIEGAKVI